jgi:hypothetical protein
MIGPFDFLLLRKNRGDELEAAIDNAIRHAAAWKSLGPITMSARGWSADVIDAVLERYRAKGWRAHVVDDARDGDFISLEVPS